MNVTEYRKCGICDEATIPRGLDWPWWSAGQPMCVACANAHRLATIRVSEDVALDPAVMRKIMESPAWKPAASDEPVQDR